MMARQSYGPYSHSLHSYGLHSYGLYSYGLYSYGLYSYGLYSYGPCSFGNCTGMAIAGDGGLGGHQVPRRQGARRSSKKNSRINDAGRPTKAKKKERAERYVTFAASVATKIFETGGRAAE